MSRVKSTAHGWGAVDPGQLNLELAPTGQMGANEVHLHFDDRGSDPSSPSLGDVWRNGSYLKTLNGLSLGSASTTAQLVLNGAFSGSDVILANNTAFVANPTGNDQLGMYVRAYGAVSNFTSPRVITGAAFASAPQFTFTASGSGDVLGSEATVLLQGGAAGGNFVGSLRAHYAHVDFVGTGNNITIDNVYGLRADIGLSSSGNAYTVTNAACVYAGIPTAGNIGTLTNSRSIFSESDLAIGGTVATPKTILKPDGAIYYTDGIAAPATASGFSSVYVDTSDGDYKIKFADGITKTLAVDTTGSGSFTSGAAGLTVVSDARVSASSQITITATNPAAGLLMRSKSCWIDAIGAGSFNFNVSATGAGAPAGTETFNFMLLPS